MNTVPAAGRRGPRSKKEGESLAVERYTVDLSDYPDLVVIYLGMRARSARGQVGTRRHDVGVVRTADQASRLGKTAGPFAS
jgi:hypothetical protein